MRHRSPKLGLVTLGKLVSGLVSYLPAPWSPGKLSRGLVTTWIHDHSVSLRRVVRCTRIHSVGSAGDIRLTRGIAEHCDSFWRSSTPESVSSCLRRHRYPCCRWCGPDSLFAWNRNCISSGSRSFPHCAIYPWRFANASHDPLWCLRKWRCHLGRRVQTSQCVRGTGA